MALPDQPGFAIWLTGLPAAGKSSLARAMHQQLRAQGIQTVIVDSDALRQILTPDPNYSEAERDWFYQVLADLAAWLVAAGLNVLLAATAHRQAYRARARAEIDRFAEVYVHCDLALCRERDPKGIYALADAGQAASVPGVGVAYEPPLQPEATVDTGILRPEPAAAAVLAQLGFSGKD